MKIKELFDECVKKAIELGRPYMDDYIDVKPTNAEWELALILFKMKIKIHDSIEW